MALYDKLPVYKACYDLLLRLYEVSKNMERDYKFTLGENIKNEAMQLIILIYKANTRRDKLEHLQIAKEKVEVIRLLLRVYNDLKQISLKQFVSVSEKLESVSKQINAWHASQRGGTKSTKTKNNTNTTTGRKTASGVKAGVSDNTLF